MQRIPFVPRDKFPGWYVVAGCFLVLTVASGFGFYGPGVLNAAFKSELGWSPGFISIASTTNVLIGGVWTVYLARLISRYDARFMMVMGSLMAATSMILFGHMTEKWQLFPVYALFMMGLAAAGPPVSTAVTARWFDTKRSAALSLVGSGLGVGGMLLTPWMKHRIDHLGLADAMPTVALLLVVGVSVPALLLVRGDPYSMGWMPDGAPAPEGHVGNPSGTPFAEAVRTAFFRRTAIGFAMVFGMQIGFVSQQVIMVSDRTNSQTAAFSLSLFAGSNLVIRAAGAKIIPKFPVVGFAGALMFIQGGLIIALGQVTNRTAILILMAALGAALGNLFIMQSVVPAERFGVRDFPRIAARFNIYLMVGQALGPITIGFLRDFTGDYNIPFALGGTVSLCGALIFLSAGPVTRKTSTASV